MLRSKAQLNNKVKYSLLGVNLYKLNNQAMLDDKDIGRRLRQAMDEARVSNALLAEKTGVSLQAVGAWIKTGKIARERLPAIKKALNVSIEWLLTNEGNMRLEDTEARLTPQQRNLLSLFESLTDDQQKDFIKDIADTKRKNDKMYAELKRKYEGGIASSQQSSIPAPERRKGEDRRQSINVVDTDFRTCLDRRQDEAVIAGPGESLDEAKARWRDREKNQEK